MMKKVLTAVWALFAGLMLMVQPAQASWEEASAVVDKSTGEMLGLLSDDKYLADENYGELINEIDGLLEPVVDFPYIAKLVMGKHYRKANADSRSHFADVFRTTLIKTYAKAVVGFRITGYEIKAPKKRSPKPDKQIVTVEVTSDNGTRYSLVYYMRKKQGEWRLVNVVLDGVNLRLTFKNQFSDLVQKSRGNVAKAVEQWQQKIDPDSVAPKGEASNG